MNQYRDTSYRLAHDAEFRALVNQLAGAAESLGLTPGEIKQVAFAAAVLVEQRRVPVLVRSAVEKDSGVQRMPPTLDELHVRLEQELAREPENRGDEEN